MHGIAQPDAFQTWEVQEATCFNNLFVLRALLGKYGLPVMDSHGSITGFITGS